MGISEDRGRAPPVVERRFFYDRATALTPPPTRGLLPWVDPGCGDRGWVTERAGYDAWGNLAVLTDARGFATTFGDDPTGHRRRWARDPLGHLTRCEYNGQNESDPKAGRGPVRALRRVVDPNGAAETYG